jgi:hypothetical protein
MAGSMELDLGDDEDEEEDEHQHEEKGGNQMPGGQNPTVFSNPTEDAQINTAAKIIGAWSHELSDDNAARCAAEVVEALWAIHQSNLNPELPPFVAHHIERGS